jgi:hypothetical protein
MVNGVTLINKNRANPHSRIISFDIQELTNSDQRPHPEHRVINVIEVEKKYPSETVR